MPGPPTAPDLALLTGPSVPDILDAALAPAAGSLRGWRLRDVDHRPGNRTTASYVVRVAWADGEREETFAATVSGRRPADGLVVTNGDRFVQVWRFPYDPELPALPAASFASSVGDLLSGLGIAPDGVQLRVVSYRPRKRAIVEVVTERQRLFIKVLRPRQVRDIDSRHRVLTAAGVAGWVALAGVSPSPCCPSVLPRAVVATGRVVATASVATAGGRRFPPRGHPHGDVADRR